MTEERRRDILVRLALVAAGLAPAAALGAAFWPELSSHPAVTVAAVAGYTVLISAVAFLGKVASDLQRRWAERTGDAIDRRLRWTISRFERAYRAQLRSRHRFVDLQGLSTRGDHTPKLKHVFVDVSLVRRAPHLTTQDSPVGPGDRTAHSRAERTNGVDRAGNGAARTDDTPSSGIPDGGRPAGAPGSATAEHRVRYSVTDLLGGSSSVALAVIGAPGTGKTTLLKHLALQPPTARRGFLRRAPRRDLPILLHLHGHAARITEDPSVTLPEIVRASLGGFAAQEPPGWFEQQLAAGRCLVLLDGLDEVAREDDRQEVSGWVEQQIESYEQNDFVITSRPHGYQNTRLNRPQVLQVQRFTGEQINRFVYTWYRAAERLDTREDDAYVADRADQAARDLLDRIRERPVLHDLAANPLLLTMTALVHRYRDVLPRSRAELYAEICEVLLWRRRDAKKIGLSETTDLTGRQKEAILREMAFTMMVERRRDLSEEEADEALKPVLDLVSADISSASFLRLISASGLLVEHETGRYSFAHLTLQEHLAALCIQEYGLSDVLIGAVEDDWWRETTLLYAARVDPAPIVEACMAPGRNPTTLALAFDCAEVATKFHPATARQLEELRRQALRGPLDSARHRLITAVTVTRALRETISISEEVQLTARPISREVFRLFLASGHGAGGYEPPVAGAHLGAADEPATGVTRRQASAVLRWVNGLLPDGVVYRLPTRDEIADVDHSHRATHPCWYSGIRRSTAAPATLWVPEHTKHPWSGVLPAAADWPDAETWALLRVGQVGLAHAHARELVRALDSAQQQNTVAEPRYLVPAQGIARRLAANLELARRLDLGLDTAWREDVAQVSRDTAELADAIDRARNADLAYDLDHEVGRTRAAEYTEELSRLRESTRLLAERPTLRYLARRLRGLALVHAVLREHPPTARTGVVPTDMDHTVQLMRSYLAEHRGAQVVPPDALRAALGDPAPAEGTAPHPGTGKRSTRSGPSAGGASPERAGPGRQRGMAASRRPAERPAQRSERAGERGPSREAQQRQRGRRRLSEQVTLLTEDARRRAQGALRDRDTMDRSTAISLQLATLALAAATDGQQQHDPLLAARYRTAAVGATVQRRRAEGDAAAPETVLLVRDMSL